MIDQFGRVWESGWFSKWTIDWKADWLVYCNVMRGDAFSIQGDDDKRDNSEEEEDGERRSFDFLF